MRLIVVRRMGPLLVGLALLGVAGSVRAEPGAVSASTIAEGLFRQARELSKAGRDAEACPKFEESQRLEPKLGTLLNLALCHEAVGRIATAWTELRAAAAQAGREGQKDRESFARDRAASLEKKLPYLVLVGAGATPAGLTLTLDLQPIGASVLGAPIPIDPGEHVVVASAPGRASWTGTVVIPAGPGETRFSVPELAPAAPPPVPSPAAPAAPAAPVSAPAPTPAPALAPAPKTEPERPPGADLFLRGGLIVGSAGMLVGIGAGLATLSEASDLEAACTNGTCPPEQEEALSRANTLANVSNAGFAMGLLGLGAAAGAYWLWPSADKPSSPPKTTVTPALGASFVGVVGQF